MPTAWADTVAAVTGGITSITGTITGNAVLLLAVVVPFVGAVIGLTKRLFRFRRR